MKLEAAKEMDRRCVLNWLNEVYVTPSRAFNEYTDDELKMFAHDALVLLNEQEEVEPTRKVNENGQILSCGNCGTWFIVQKQKYCHECGRAVKWE